MSIILGVKPKIINCEKKYRLIDGKAWYGIKWIQF